MIVLNGAFGIGKTTAARCLRARLAGSAIFDPELVGIVLQRLPSWVPLEGRGSDDFQDLALWRRASIRGIRLVRALRRTVIVPMAVSNLAYLHELHAGVQRFDPVLRHFCLTAPFAVVRERLAKRAGGAVHRVPAWQLRRAEECCAAHSAPAFAEHIPTEHRTPEQVAEAIEARIASLPRAIPC